MKDLDLDEELGRAQGPANSHGYHEVLEPEPPRTFGSWKILVVTLSLVSMISMAVLAVWALDAKVAGAAAVKETVNLGSWSDSIEGCRWFALNDMRSV